MLHEQVEIPALGHKEEILPAIAATCTKDGWSEGKKCSVCGLILKSRKLIKATGHKEEIIPAVAATPGTHRSYTGQEVFCLRQNPGRTEGYSGTSDSGDKVESKHKDICEDCSR